MARDFCSRSRETEMMDEEAVGYEDFRACLRDLSSVNTVTLGRWPTISWLERAVRIAGAQRFSLLDVGFGYGDMLRTIHAWCGRNGIEADLAGIDLNPFSAQAAREVTSAQVPVAYHTGDVFAFEPDRRFDYIVSSLFTHHLPDEALVAFLRWMEARAVKGWFVNDLHRHPLPFYGFGLLARLAGWHRFVRHDGPVSIARAFRREDWLRALRNADIDPSAATIRWHMPFRLCVGRLK